MNLNRTGARRTTVLVACTAASILALPAVAFADNIQDTIVDTGSVTLQAGATTGGTAAIRVVGNNSDGTTTDAGCNWDPGESPLQLDVVTPAGVTATPDPVTITACGVDATVSFTAAAGAQSGVATVSIVSAPAGGGGYNNQVSIPITVTAPANTKPSVAVTGAVHGMAYEIGSAPTPACSVTDTEDGPSSHAAVVTGTLTHGLGELTATCTYTDGGQVAADPASVTYSVVDTGLPTISASALPAANSFGWRNTDVTISFTCADAGGSGIQSCLGGTTLTEGAGQSATGTATDWAGNTRTLTVPATGVINIDKTAPVVTDDSVTTAPTGTAGDNGWWRSDVTVTYRASDNLSGFDGKANPHTFTRTTNGDGAAVTVGSGTVTDLAGNESGSVTSQQFSIDRVAPAVGSAVLSSTSTPNALGWYQAAVTASFTATDATSGVVGTATRTVSTGTDQGTTTLQSPEFKDIAGNTTSAGARSVTVKVDTEAPTVALVDGPEGGESYFYGSVPGAPTCTASDATSGLDGICSISGYGAGVGSHTVVATATDNAGHTSTSRRQYTVLAWTTKGFYSPVDMGGVLNVVKGGSTVPLKFELFAGATELTSLSDIKSFTTAKVNCTALTGAVTDEIEVVSTGGTALRYDTMAGQFIQNWKTPTGAGTCYKATMTAQDGSALAAFFKIR